MIGIEVVYARKDRAIIKKYDLPPHATVGEALSRAADDADFVGIDWQNVVVGVFGRVVSAGQPLEEGDRVEIYRPLQEDPKLARRRRVKKSYGS